MFCQLVLLAVSSLLTQAVRPGFQPNPAHIQTPLGVSQRFSAEANKGEFNFTTASLNSLSSSEFTTFHHPHFPRHSLRIKRTSSDWCDHSVASYTGYIDTTETHHIFFYFFESRNDPDTDDVILWTNGGPGCTSSLGLFMELGPCRVVDSKTTKWHPQAWNERANVFFIDQPIGVGYSYADYGEQVSTTEEAAQDIASFVAMFFDTFSRFKGRGFHMAGESYGGQYIPIYAAAIYDQNKQLVKAGLEPVNLKSVMIGNGITNAEVLEVSYYDHQCAPAFGTPYQNIEVCVRMKTAVPRCEKWLRESCIDVFDVIGCRAAKSFCEAELSAPFQELELNPYNVKERCTPDEMNKSLCYPIIGAVAAYINSTEIRRELGASEALKNHIIDTCDAPLFERFTDNLDELRLQTSFYLENLLERGVNVLIYVGMDDWICNWIGNKRMTEALEWHGAERFRKQDLQNWSRKRGQENHKPSGLFKTSGPLTFLTIFDAGHMVPYDKPDEALEMVDRWLAGNKF